MSVEFNGNGFQSIIGIHHVRIYLMSLSRGQSIVTNRLLCHTAICHLIGNVLFFLFYLPKSKFHASSSFFSLVVIVVVGKQLACYWCLLIRHMRTMTLATAKECLLVGLVCCFFFWLRLYRWCMADRCTCGLCLSVLFNPLFELCWTFLLSHHPWTLFWFEHFFFRFLVRLCLWSCSCGFVVLVQLWPKKKDKLFFWNTFIFRNTPNLYRRVKWKKKFW